MKKESIKVTPKEILDYWKERIYEGDLGVDISEGLEHCWRCGCKKVLHKCHIIPESLGGVTEASNLILLCGVCHGEAPNVNNKKTIFRWIQQTKKDTYNTFWILRWFDMYKILYGTSVEEELKRCKQTTKENLHLLISEAGNLDKNTGLHFSGHAVITNKITDSTGAVIIRRVLKKLQ